MEMYIRNVSVEFTIINLEVNLYTLMAVTKTLEISCVLDVSPFPSYIHKQLSVVLWINNNC